MTDQLTLSLRELVAAAALMLSHVGLDQKSGRVSEVPTARTIRFYATHGLLAPPDSWRGRTALYGARHVLTLVAIKRLQSRGLTLEEVYEKVTGADVSTLETLSDMTLSNLTVFLGGDTQKEAKRPDPPGATAFWRQVPEAVDLDQLERDQATSSGATKTMEEAIRGVRLDPGVMLVIEGSTRPMDADDLAAIQAAAGPLVRLLHARNLVGEDA